MERFHGSAIFHLSRESRYFEQSPSEIVRVEFKTVIFGAVAHVEQLYDAVAFLQEVAHASFYECDFFGIDSDLLWKAAEFATTAERHRVDDDFFINSLLSVNGVLIMSD